MCTCFVRRWLAVVALLTICGCGNRPDADPSSILGMPKKSVRKLLGTPRVSVELNYGEPGLATPPLSDKERDSWLARQLAAAMSFKTLAAATNGKGSVFAVARTAWPDERQISSAREITAGMTAQAVRDRLGEPSGAQAYRDIVSGPPDDADIIRGWAQEAPVTVLWYGPVRIVLDDAGKVVEVDEPTTSLYKTLNSWLP